MVIRDKRVSVVPLRNAFGKIENILGPHQHKQESVRLINAFSLKCRENIWLPVSLQLLRLICPCRRRSYLVIWKMYILSQISKTGNNRSVIETLRYLDKYFGKQRLVEKEQMEHLRRLHAIHHIAIRKMDEISKELSGALDAKNCRNPKHYRAAGCPKCGVIFIGKGFKKDPFLLDVSQGVLVPLSTVIEGFEAKVEVQRQSLMLSASSVDEYKSSVFADVAGGIQFWWIFRYCSIVEMKKSKQIRRSLMWYRIRKLRCLKNDVDALVSIVSFNDLREDNPLFMLLQYRYSFVLVEANEYIKRAIFMKLDRIDWIVRWFVAQIRLKILKKRKRERAVIDFDVNCEKYYDWIHSLDKESSSSEDENSLEVKKMELKRKKAKKITKLFKNVTDQLYKDFCCPRPECNNRKFLSIERYRTHMRVMHYEGSDFSKKIAAEKGFGRGVLRENREKSFLERFRQCLEVGKGVDVPEDHVEFEDLSVLTSESVSDTVSVDKLHIPFASNQNIVLKSDILNSRIDSSDWSRVIFAQNHRKLLYLELVSCRKGISVAPKVALNAPVIRIGTLSREAAMLSKAKEALSALPLGCEVVVRSEVPDRICQINVKDAYQRAFPLISPVHCAIYCANHDEDTEKVSSNDILPCKIVDNHSYGGTYVINNQGSFKISSSISKMKRLEFGDLVCLGVGKLYDDSGNAREFTYADVQNACVIFQVKM